jgi:hypothetical protein
VIVRFVDIGGIDDHHCLNFLFIIKDNFQQSLMSNSLLRVVIGGPLQGKFYHYLHFFFLHDFIV